MFDRTPIHVILAAGICNLAFASASLAAVENENPAGKSAEAPQGIEEIVVTAQRREESVQRAAVAIEVLTADSLVNQGITGSSDLTRIATGVQASGSGFNQIYIRGVGDFGVTISANPAVVTNLNGIPISRPQVIGGNFFDLERVEVLKGPQGTLYGRNASGGAINLVAVPPKLGVASGYFSGTYGSYAALQGDAAINLPVGDRSAVRLAGQISDRNGYLSDGTDDDKHQSVRLQGLHESERLTTLVRVGYQHNGGVGAGLAVIPRLPGRSAWTGTASAPSMDFYFAEAAANFAASGGASPPPELLRRIEPGELFQDVKSATFDGQIDYKFDGATLTVIPAYRWVHSRFTLPISYFYGNGARGSDGDRSKQYSIEARLGNSTDQLKWVAGVFALKENVSSDFVVDAGLIQNIRLASDQSTKTFAIFGEATHSLTHNFRVTAGGRWTTDKRDAGNVKYAGVSPTVTGNPPCLPDFGFPIGTECSVLPPGANYDSSRTFRRITWRGGFEYDLAPQSMLFFNVAKGFKAGGFNVAVDPANTKQLLSFDPELMTAFTLGLRNRFVDNSIQLNLEGFYWDYKNLQLSQIILDGAGNLAAATQNAGGAHIYGLNVDAIVKPREQTSLRAAIEYLHARYMSYLYSQAAALTPPGSVGCPALPSHLPAGPLGPFVDINCKGFPLTRAPKWSGTLSLSQMFDLAKHGSVKFDTDYVFSSKRYVANSFTKESLAGGYGVLSAVLTYTAPNERLSMGGFVRNITNTAAYIGGGEQAPYVPQFLGSSIMPPRTYGVNIKISF